MERFNFSDLTNKDVVLLNAYANLRRSISFSAQPSILPQLLEALHHHVEHCLQPDSISDGYLHTFCHGQGLQAYVQLATESKELDLKLWDSICTRGAKCSNLPAFLNAVFGYVSAIAELPECQEGALEEFAGALISNLSGPSHPLRLISLKILRELVGHFGVDDKAVSIAIEIEGSELTLQTARNLSMEIRRLAMSYADSCSKKWQDRLIPNFCFGLLSKRLSSAWEDACNAVKIISEQRTGEQIVSDLAIQWLHEPGVAATDKTDAHDEENGDTPNADIYSEFGCFNVTNTDRSISLSFSQSKSSESILIQDFESAHRPAASTPQHARSQALRVLNAVPHIAEKRSRQLVPVFLEWAFREDDISTTSEFDPKNSDGPMTGNDKSGWNLRDKKDMLSLFGKFQNPKVLYKSSDVHDALAGLLCNGDSEIQKLALQAILTWKSPSLLPYEENLMNIVDDARFRDELSVFVHIGQDNSVIKDEHRPGLLPYVLRLLYGKVVARAGSKGALGAQEVRRKAILRTVSELPEEDFGHFIQISYGTLYDLQVLDTSSDGDGCLSREFMGMRKQYGLLRMIESMLSILKSRMAFYCGRSMNVILYCLVRACRYLRDTDAASTTGPDQTLQVALARNIRTIGIRSLELVFSVSSDTDWTAYIPLIFTEVIEPRLDNFAVETAQGVSGLLQLFRTWAAHPRSARYFIDESILSRVLECLAVQSARDEVKLFVIDDILHGLLKSATSPEPDEDGDADLELSEYVRSMVLAPHVESMLSQLESLLRSQLGRQLTMSAVEILSNLATFVRSSGETSRLISTTTFLLKQGPDRVPPKTKGALLRVLQNFLPLYNPQKNAELGEQIFGALSSLFEYFKDEPNRETLGLVFKAFANHDAEIKEVADLCADLNSLSRKKLDEVDFERRLAAFNVINEQRFETFTARQWQPLVFNMLYYVKDVDELAIRSSASLGLKRFILSSETKLQSGENEFGYLLEKVLLPALRAGVKQSAETVRAEFVGILGYLIQHHQSRPSVQDMCGLLAGGDEEASFFNNILHIQQHRRLRSLRRLAAEATSDKLKPSNVSSIFFPLIEHFVFSPGEDESAHNLTAETVSTVGALASCLEWNQFRAIFRRYKEYMKSKPGMEKNVIRLLGHMTDALSRVFSVDSATPTAAEDSMEDIESNAVGTSLGRSLPSKAVVASELKTNFISSFTEFIHHKEESEVSLRLPVSVTTVKLIKLLEENERPVLLPPVLLAVSNVLKSRSQDSRDIARKTLGDIARILGPSYFDYILRELRTSLTKGYQLHVLSFTVHSILVTTSDEFKPGDLDENLAELATVVMDDVFGTVGQEKDAEEYVSKMKEVKSSKSYDSMELLSKNASIQHLARLLQPVQRLLQEKLTSSLVKKIDELLRRIVVGVLRNPGAESRDLLVFCYEVIKESYNTETPQNQGKPKDRFLVNLVGQKKSGTGRSTSSYLHKLARFSLDLMRSVLNKYNSLQTSQNLQGFLPVIGDALVQGHEEVKLSAIRLLATIIKLPLPDLDEHADVYLVESIKMIREAPSTNTEAAQVSLKFIAAILRERRSTQIKDSYLAYLLKRITGDIEEPDRQGVTFNFIRAVMARKFVVPEMYELVDSIGAMMVTNQTRSARDLARGIYVHFIVEYPQVKSRWSKQLGFMAKNLEYHHKEGRQSVMEAVHHLLSKTGGDLAQDLVSTFFVPVIMTMSNDESADCREMASALLGSVFSRADSENLKSILALLRTWVEQEENTLLVVAGLQAMRVFIESDVANKTSEVRFVTSVLPRLLTTSPNDQDDNGWQLLFQSLQLFSKVCKHFPAFTLSAESKDIWAKVQAYQTYPHPWIKLCAANLIGTWFADEAKANAASGYGSVPLAGSFGLILDENMMLHVTKASMGCLKSRIITEDLATQSVRNLVFLGRCFGQNHLSFPRNGSEESIEEEEEEIGDESDNENTADTPSDSSKGSKPAIQYIFEQSSGVLRREPFTTRGESLTAKTVCMKLIATLCSQLETAQIMPSLQTLLLPLLHLTDPSIPPPRSSDETFQTAYKGLVQSSHEILDLLQKKLGTTDFVAQVSRVREKVKTRREDRRVKRRIETVADPEKAGLDKRRKHERKREKRKEQGHDFRGKRRGW